MGIILDLDKYKKQYCQILNTFPTKIILLIERGLTYRPENKLWSFNAYQDMKYQIHRKGLYIKFSPNLPLLAPFRYDLLASIICLKSHYYKWAFNSYLSTEDLLHAVALTNRKCPKQS